jgi:type IV secretory pathway VirB4 component
MNPVSDNQPTFGNEPTNYASGEYGAGSVNAPPIPNHQPVPLPPPKGHANSTQNALQISEIRDGVVIMNDGTFRAVIMCKSINFDLMSPQEREAIEFSYQGFLNSLYFPVQIFIRSQKVDMRPYLEKLDKIRTEQDNMLLSLLMEDYIAFLADIAQQTNIMDKKFYMVIKYPDLEVDVRKALKQSAGFFTGLINLFTPNKAPHVVIDENTLEKAKTELRNRVQSVMQGLSQGGIQSLPLDTEELIELYYDAYNPDTATRQQIKDFKDLTAPVIEKGEGNALQPGLDREVNQ